jgi:hypothetical protein
VSIRPWQRHDGNTQAIIGTEADFVSSHSNDAGIPTAEHLDAGAAAQSKLLQTVDMVRRA